MELAGVGLRAASARGAWVEQIPARLVNCDSTALPRTNPPRARKTAKLTLNKEHTQRSFMMQHHWCLTERVCRVRLQRGGRALILAGLLLAFAFSAGMAAAADSARPMRIHYFGNSLTDEVKYDWFQKLATDAGHPVEWKREMAPGVPVFHHWSQKAKWEKKLTEERWDVVTLQPFQNFELEYQACESFAKFLNEKQPDAQLYIYAQWPSRKSANWFADFTRTSEVQAKSGWDANCRQKAGEAFYLEKVAADAQAAGTQVTGGPVRAERSLKNQYELTAQGLRARVPMKKPVKMIPVGHVMELLGSKMRAGQVPGYQSPHGLYSDGVHVSNVGSYIVACTFYATIFKTSPVGLPIGEYQANPRHHDDRFPISDELARIIQETVWEVVATHPLTGVSSDEKVKVATASFERAVQGEPYAAEIAPAFGKAPYAWKVISGDLPKGLSLAEGGAIAGIVAAEPGAYEVEFAVTDAAGATAGRRLSLHVDADTAPAVATAAQLPPRRIGPLLRRALSIPRTTPPAPPPPGALWRSVVRNSFRCRTPTPPRTESGPTVLPQRRTRAQASRSPWRYSRKWRGGLRWGVPAAPRREAPRRARRASRSPSRAHRQ